MIIGWDISTSAIGVCVRRDGHPDEFHVIFPEGKTHLQKWRSATDQVTELMRTIPESDHGVTHVVEERLGGFTGGLTTKQTLMALSAMNAVVAHLLSHTGDVIFIPPVTTKRITGLIVDKAAGEDKKSAVVKLARQLCPSFPYVEGKTGKWVKGTDDMADAWLLAEAGLKITKGEATLGPKTKVKRGKGQARSAKDRGQK